MSSKIFLVWIVFLAFSLRYAGASIVQRGFDGDEAAFGYYGYSLSENMSDEYGNKLPLYFPSIGDYKYPVYAYLTSVPVAIFGLNEISSRLISIIAGSFLPIILFFIAKSITSRNSISLTAALLAAISPYGIMFSGGAYESNLATVLVSAGIMFLLMYQKSYKNMFLVFSFILFVLSIFTYSPTRLYLVLFLPLSYILYFRSVSVSKILRILIVSFVVFTFIVSVDERSRVRAHDISVFGKNESTLYESKELLNEDKWVFVGNKYELVEQIHSVGVIKITNFTRNYLSHLSPQYLFIEGNQNMPKYSVPGIGLFYIFEAISILLGMVFIAKQNRKDVTIVYLWLAIALIPSALTIETPNPIRALLSLPPLIILSSFGLYYFFASVTKGIKFREKVISFSLFIFIFMNLAYFWHQYTVHDIYRRPWSADGGTKEMVDIVTDMSDDYDNIVIGGDPYIFFLFYKQIPPDIFMKDATVIEEKVGVWERVSKYKNITFNMKVPCPKIGRKATLYVCRGNEIPQNSILHKTVYFNDGTPAFLLLEFVPYSQRVAQTLPENITYMVETDLSYDEALLPNESERYW